MQGKSYRELEAWREAMTLVEEVYRATASFPQHEIYGLTQQIRRSAVSIPSNIAEGQGRKSPGGFKYHTLIARGSLCELETQLLLAERLAYLECEKSRALQERMQLVGRLIGGLVRYLEPLT